MTSQETSNIVYLKQSLVSVEREVKVATADVTRRNAGRHDTILNFPQREASATNAKLFPPDQIAVVSLSPITAKAAGRSPNGWPNRNAQSRKSDRLTIIPPADIQDAKVCDHFAIERGEDEGMRIVSE